MNNEQVQILANNCSLPDTCQNVTRIETHISWIVLTDQYAFKIKRPVKYSFLDFSTLEKRKYFCNQEIVLNKRLAPNMYLRVVPISREMLGDKHSEEIVDYAVQMKRMDNDREMGNLLAKNKVAEHDIDKLVDKIARFHQKAEIVKNAFNTVGFQSNYEEIKDDIDYIQAKIGDEWVSKIEESIEESNVYLNEHRNYINERIIRGYRKNCHGDLSSHNIFLYDDPVIFDCIEFNDKFRHIDVLNEIAFLCTDLDFYDQQKLGERFYTGYINKMGFADDEQTRKMFNYYKSYRANVRAKVTLLHEKKSNGNNNPKAPEDIRKYIDLMESYIKNIN